MNGTFSEQAPHLLPFAQNGLRSVHVECSCGCDAPSASCCFFCAQDGAQDIVHTSQSCSHEARSHVCRHYRGYIAMGPVFPLWVTPSLEATMNKANVNLLTYGWGGELVHRFLGDMPRSKLQGPKYVWAQLQ